MNSLTHKSRALEALHQVSPALIAACFVLGIILDVAIRLHSRRRASQKRWRQAAISLVWLATFSYANEAVLCVVHNLIDRGWWAPQDRVIFTISSVLVWGVMSLILLDFQAPRWAPYVASWILGLVLETVMSTLYFSVYLDNKNFTAIQRAVILLRLTTLSLLAFVGITILALEREQERRTDEEYQSLLGNGTRENERSGMGYGSIIADDLKGDDGETEEDESKEIKERQRQRLLQAGGWWAYLKSFLVLFPIMWPAKTRKIRLYCFAMVVCMVSKRAFNILIPRQVGIITDKLMVDYGTSRLPLREILVWISLQFLNSRMGIDGISSMVSTILQQFSTANLTKAAFKHVMGLSMDFHTEKNTGELIKAVDQGHSIASILQYVFLDTTPLIMDLVGAFIYLNHLFDAYLALTVIALAVTYLYSTVKLTSYSADRRRTFIDRYMKESQIIYESISNWQTVAYFNRGSYEKERLNAAVTNLNDSYIRYSFTYNLIFATQALITLTGLVAASLIATYRISQGTAKVGSFVALLQYWGTLSSPLSNLANSYNRLSSDLIDAERVLQLFLTTNSAKEKPDARPLKFCGGRIEYKAVNFAYDPRKPTLSNVSFTSEPGQTVALVGETGSGKSTILKLLLRFYDVTDGSIKIDDQDLRDVTLSSLREIMGVVPQDPSMFNMSIMQNIRYARLDASDEEVYAACRAAALHDKIMTFPDGYNSKVGEHGMKLSGGELQRVAIARVLLKNPLFVLLDEATSAVDSATETQIQESFKRLSKGRTTFVIAHRLSTIMDADLILVLENGQIIERGTQQELLKLGGKYLDLWTKQTSRKAVSLQDSTAKD
ncbi:putative ABC transporter [Macrophomina phaseolina]|uniref:ABC transporter n=1 Tax=Macrophomina phaseolina TaxID=35725 RepID=A0ABQ8G8C4_9PEZI|nr:putative ABC transporter [Macrophomina phaseolina]